MKKIIMIVAFVACLPIYGCGSDLSECETDNDCFNNETCNAEYQCVDFWNEDNCLGAACGEAYDGDCVACGPYTACSLEGECINACDVFNKKYRDEVVTQCKDYPTCKYCECASLGLNTPLSNEDVCEESFEKICTEISSVEIENMNTKINNFTETSQEITNKINIYCTDE